MDTPAEKISGAPKATEPPAPEPPAAPTPGPERVPEETVAPPQSQPSQNVPENAQAAPAEPSEPPEPPGPAPEPGPSREELEALKAELAAQRAAIESAKAQAREDLADRLGVLPNFRAYLPEVDPFSADGKAAIQKWADEHPEALRATGRPDSRPTVADVKAKIDKAPNRWLVSDEMLRRAYR